MLPKLLVVWLSNLFLVVFCSSLFVPLSYFFCPLCCLSVTYLRFMIIPLIPSNLSFTLCYIHRWCSFIKQFQVWLHLCVLLSNNWYQRYNNAIFINWPTWTPRNWKRRRLWTKIETKETILIFPMWIFHLNVATFLQHLRMEYISKFIRYSRAYDSIVIYLIESFRWQVTAQVWSHSVEGLMIYLSFTK